MIAPLKMNETIVKLNFNTTNVLLKCTDMCNRAIQLFKIRFSNVILCNY